MIYIYIHFFGFDCDVKNSSEIKITKLVLYSNLKYLSTFMIFGEKNYIHLMTMI